MSLFKDILRDDESLFKGDAVALDFDFQPKLIPFREKEQFSIANCVKPLFSKRNGKNVFIVGRPGVGKTVACKHVLNELEEETDEIIPIYINCWKKNTTYKVFLELCDILGYKFVQNKKSDELFDKIKEILNKNSVVFVFDEIDKVEDYSFLYTLLEEIYRKTIILITNHKSWIMSRLTPEVIEFMPYNHQETTGILEQRRDLAFTPNIWDEQSFIDVVRRTSELKDIRSGLYLMKESGNAAENESSRKVLPKHVDIAYKKLNESNIKSSDLEDDTKFILDIVKKNPATKIGDLFNTYSKEGGKGIYKTFQRKIKKLEDDKVISVKKTAGGAEGNTSIISYLGEVKKLSDY
jgi:cell division control protein 6